MKLALTLALGFVVTALAQPSISIVPSSQTVLLGEQVLLSVQTSDPGPLSYQWQLNGTNLNVPVAIVTLAGGYTGDQEVATKAMIQQAKAVAVDSGGNVYIADTTGNRVRKVGIDGVLQTVAGCGISGFVALEPHAAARNGGCFRQTSAWLKPVLTRVTLVI